MPYRDDLRPQLLERLKELDPDAELIEPEDDRFPEFLADVTRMDSSLAQAIDAAMVDEQAEEARLAFGSVGGPSVAGVMGSMSKRVQGKSVRGKPVVRPVTLGFMLAGLVGAVFLITAFLPESKAKTATVASSTGSTSAAPASQASSSLPTSTVQGTSEPGASANAATIPASSTGPVEAGSVTSQAPAPEPVTADPGYVSQSVAPAPITAAPVASSEPAPVASSYSVPPVQAGGTLQSAPAPVVGAPVSASGQVVKLTPASSVAAGEELKSSANVTAPEVPDGLVSGNPEARSSGEERAGLVSGGGQANGAVQRDVLVSGPAPSAPQQEVLVSSGTSEAPRTALVSGDQGRQEVGARTGLVSSGEVTRAVPAAQPAAVSSEVIGSAMGGQLNAGGAPAPSAFTPGSVIRAKLDMAVGVYVGANQPVWAKGEDGSVWRGEATVDPASQRIMISFKQVLKDSQVFPVTAYVESADGVGVGGHTRQVSRDVARAVMNSLLNAAVGFVQSQSAQTTTITPTTVVQSQQPQNFWMALGGGLAQAFVIPDVKASMVLLGEIPAGEVVAIRIDFGGQ